ncbi:DUF3488 and transglutaminase-like domain-containing protein [Thalassoglobus sp. JC818]|uniref:transglutaminase TgpA family protein n=1 Tax=Thalassoglobus sp. JC818 TaxID=3232136 RepID=UPI0034576FD5
MRQILYISLTVMISLSGIVFAVAEGSPLAGVTLLIALATLLFVDIEDKFSVPVSIANTLGLIAFFVAGIEFFGGQIESRLLAGGHLIVYLTWVNLIQKKSNRQIWWLCALSILQIATASVLTTSMWFGGALVLYSFVATWTLSVFLLYRSTKETDDTQKSGPLEQGSNFVVGDAWKGVSRDVDHRLVNFRFVMVTGVVTCLSLGIGLMFFLFTPRVWIGNYTLFGDEAVAGRSLTGFTDEVRLGDMSEIMENSAPVMQVTLHHRQQERPFTLKEAEAYFGPDPLFRGTVMEEYDNGRWKQVRYPGPETPRSQIRNTTIEQKYRMSPLNSTTLFSFGDAVGVAGRGTFVEAYSDELKRNPDIRSSQRNFEYSVYANLGPPDATKSQLRESWPPYYKMFFAPSVYFSGSSFGQQQGGYVGRQLRVPDDLQRVTDLAQSVVGDEEDDYLKVQRLLRYFDSPEFEYSLDLSVTDASIDPLEDFVFNRKSGHCEYYASAMAIMLRGVGVPSRLISGFKGGSFDADGLTFRVQQLHAHSWVEAFIDGSWLTVDPTPAAREVAVQKLEGSFLGLSELWSNIRQMWSTGVRMSKSQQQELIYSPLKSIAIESWNNVKEFAESDKTATLRSFVAFLRSPRQWFSVTGGIVAFVLMVLLSAIVWCIKKLIQLVRSINDARSMKRRHRSQVQFFDRFVQILSKMGIHQSASQTAREFVKSSMVELKQPLSDAGLSEWPDELVELFYQVRFGGSTMSPQQSQQIDRELKKLQDCVDQRENAKS